MGKIGDCNDHDLGDGLEVTYKQSCKGYFRIDITDGDNNVIGWYREQRQWVVPINNYDNIFSSMMTFFEISTLEMWPVMMYSAIDTVGMD